MYARIVSFMNYDYLSGDISHLLIDTDGLSLQYDNEGSQEHFILNDKGEEIGDLIFKVMYEEEDNLYVLELETLEVDEEERRKGYATKTLFTLLKTMQDTYDDHWCLKMTIVVGAIPFWSSIFTTLDFTRYRNEDPSFLIPVVVNGADAIGWIIDQEK